MLKFSIPDDFSGDHISIFRFWPTTKWKHSDDECEVEIEIKAGNFGGRYKAELFLGEMFRLKSDLERLYKNLSGSLEFQTLEQQLEFKITGNGRGQFEAECEAQESFNGSRLIFTLDFDQTFLPHMIRELEEMLA